MILPGVTVGENAIVVGCSPKINRITKLKGMEPSDIGNKT